MKKILFVIAIFFVAFLGNYLGNLYYDSVKKPVVEKKNNKKEESKQEEIIDLGKIEISYAEDKKEFISDNGKLKITNVIKYPNKITIDEKIEEKIISYLKGIVEEKFIDVNNQAQEQIYDYNSDKVDDSYEYGVIYSFSEMLVSYDVISFVLTTDGSMGGVAWNSKEYYNLSTNTGKILKLDDICLNVSECKKIMSDFFLKQLRNDERFNNLNDQYEEVIKDKLSGDSNWGYDSTGMHLMIAKYDISNGADGMFEYLLPKEEINGYLKDGYKI